MAIADAINNIAAAQGGTPDKSGTITGAIDALNDALAGSDQRAARTIEDAVVLLGEHIGGGGGGSFGELQTFYLPSEDENSVVFATDQELSNVIGAVLGQGLTNSTLVSAYGPAGCYFGAISGSLVMVININTQTPVKTPTPVGTASFTFPGELSPTSLDVYEIEALAATDGYVITES